MDINCKSPCAPNSPVAIPGASSPPVCSECEIIISPPTVATASIGRMSLTTAYTTAANLYSVSFLNVGTGIATVMGQPLLPCEKVEFTAYFDRVSNTFRRLPAISVVGDIAAEIRFNWMA